jgi:hypothetical protein
VISRALGSWWSAGFSRSASRCGFRSRLKEGDLSTLRNPNGFTVAVPDDAVEFYLRRGWVRPGARVAVAEPLEVPEEVAGGPDGSWSRSRLEAFAEERGIDLEGLAHKGEKLAAILAATAAPAAGGE